MKEKARENMENALITSAFFRLFCRKWPKATYSNEEYLEGEFNKSVNNDGGICDAE